MALWHHPKPPPRCSHWHVCLGGWDWVSRLTKKRGERPPADQKPQYKTQRMKYQDWGRYRSGLEQSILSNPQQSSRGQRESSSKKEITACSLHAPLLSQACDRRRHSRPTDC